MLLSLNFLNVALEQCACVCVFRLMLGQHVKGTTLEKGGWRGRFDAKSGWEETREKTCLHQRTPKGGGAKKRGGQNLTRRPPHEKQFPIPLTSVRFAPPYPIPLSKSLRNSQNFPQLTSSETIFGGSRKAVSDGPSSRGFAFWYVLPPPPLALPRVCMHLGCESGGSFFSRLSVHRQLHPSSSERLPPIHPILQSLDKPTRTCIPPHSQPLPPSTDQWPPPAWGLIVGCDAVGSAYLVGLVLTVLDTSVRGERVHNLGGMAVAYIFV